MCELLTDLSAPLISYMREFVLLHHHIYTNIRRVVMCGVCSGRNIHTKSPIAMMSHTNRIYSQNHRGPTEFKQHARLTLNSHIYPLLVWQFTNIYCVSVYAVWFLIYAKYVQASHI